MAKIFINHLIGSFFILILIIVIRYFYFLYKKDKKIDTHLTGGLLFSLMGIYAFFKFTFIEKIDWVSEILSWFK